MSGGTSEVDEAGSHAVDQRWDIVASLTRAREEAGFSQVEMARKLGVKPTTLCAFEQLYGGRDFKFGTVQRYARALGLELELRLREG